MVFGIPELVGRGVPATIFDFDIPLRRAGRGKLHNPAVSWRRSCSSGSIVHVGVRTLTQKYLCALCFDTDYTAVEGPLHEATHGASLWLRSQRLLDRPNVSTQYAAVVEAVARDFTRLANGTTNAELARHARTCADKLQDCSTTTRAALAPTIRSDWCTQVAMTVYLPKERPGPMAQAKLAATDEDLPARWLPRTPRYYLSQVDINLLNGLTLTDALAQARAETERFTRSVSADEADRIIQATFSWVDEYLDHLADDGTDSWLLLSGKARHDWEAHPSAMTFAAAAATDVLGAKAKDILTLAPTSVATMLTDIRHRRDTPDLSWIGDRVPVEPGDTPETGQVAYQLYITNGWALPESFTAARLLLADPA